MFVLAIRSGSLDHLVDLDESPVGALAGEVAKQSIVEYAAASFLSCSKTISKEAGGKIEDHVLALSGFSTQETTIQPRYRTSAPHDIYKATKIGRLV